MIISKKNLTEMNLWIHDHAIPMHCLFLNILKHVSPQPSAPPIPSEEDTLQFFDAVIASCDAERTRKPHVDNGHADVDFIGMLR